MHRDLYNKFCRVLLSYHEGSHDSPLTLKIVLVLSEFQLGCTDYSNEDIEERIDNICKRIDAITNLNHNSILSLQYSVLQLINQQFDYLRDFADAIIEASAQTLVTEDRDDSMYWLTGWHPAKVLNKENYLHRLNESKMLWEKKSQGLRDALYQLIFMPPNGDSGEHLDTLTCFPFN